MTRPCSLQTEHPSLTAIATNKVTNETLHYAPFHSMLFIRPVFGKHSERLISPLECLPEAGVTLLQSEHSPSAAEIASFFPPLF